MPITSEVQARNVARPPRPTETSDGALSPEQIAARDYTNRTMSTARNRPTNMPDTSRSAPKVIPAREMQKVMGAGEQSKGAALMRMRPQAPMQQMPYQAAPSPTTQSDPYRDVFAAYQRYMNSLGAA